MANDQAGPGLNRPHGLSESLAPGTRVGGARYILKRIVGGGAVTVVWLAWDVKLEQEVALKILPESLLRDPNAIERLKGETRRNLQLAHPHIVRTYDFVQDLRLAAIATEYVDGWSLATLQVDQPQQRYRLEQVTPWVRQLCGALTHAHTEAGILHLALKPANLLLNSREQLKLTDFGIARVLQGFADPTDLHLATEAVGLLSPQQAMGEKPSVLDDVYGLGATIYDLLTGTPPFYKGQVLAQVCDRKPPTMTERLFELGIEDSIPLVVEDTVAMCLAKDPAKRPQSVSHVLHLLERSDVPEPVTVPQVGKPAAPVQAEAPSPVPDTPVPTLPQAPAEPAQPAPLTDAPVPATSRKFLLASAAVCAVVLAGVGAWLFATHAGMATSAGSLDLSFKPATNADHEIRVALEQPDHKILIGGMFTQFGDSPHEGIACLDADGSVNSAFSASTRGDVFAFALQPDGKVLLGGLFTELNGQPCRGIGRLNADGSLDASFTARAPIKGSVRAIVVQPDGNLVVAGRFSLANARGQHRLTRLHSDGTPDRSFSPGLGPAGTVWSAAVQPDGKILLGGDFIQYDRMTYRYLVRLGPSGRPDSDFNAGGGTDAQVFAVAVQLDGKVLIGGDFTHINQVERNRVARLNPDGSVDTTFNPGAGPNSGVRCLALQPDGKVLIGGIFTSVNGVGSGRVARLNADGSLDAHFNSGDGANEVVRWVVPRADGKVIVVGGFTRFAGKPFVRVVQLLGGRK